MTYLQNFQGVGLEEDLTELAVKILCDDSTGCDKVNDYFATEAHVKMTSIRVKF